jgi:hypothetical protein
MIKKLNAMPTAQAQVNIYDDNTIVLKSYATDVARIDCDGWLEIFGLYSATTRRHISAFMREYTVFGYDTAKLIYEKKMKINIYTGEIVDL